MRKRVSASHAARNFSDLINRVRYQGTSFEIERGNEVIARIVPAGVPATLSISELNEQWTKLPHLDREDAVLFEESLKDIRKKASLPDISWD
jgi:antitoxin (DNA-binding transcriptional repressor) of toxin-antitoxin stability system